MKEEKFNKKLKNFDKTNYKYKYFYISFSKKYFVIMIILYLVKKFLYFIILIYKLLFAINISL